MKSLKALGPDGYPALFYKHYQDTVGDQVVLATQSFFSKWLALKGFQQDLHLSSPKEEWGLQFQPIPFYWALQCLLHGDLKNNCWQVKAITKQDGGSGSSCFCS